MSDVVLRRRWSLHTERVEVLFDKQHALSTTNSNTLEKTRECVDKKHDIVEDFGRTTQESSPSTGQALEGIEDKIRGLTGMSTGQSTKLDAILEALKQLLPGKAQHHASAAMELKKKRVNPQKTMALRIFSIVCLVSRKRRKRHCFPMKQSP